MDHDEWKRTARAEPPLGMPYLEIVCGEHGLPHLVLKGANHEPLMSSEPYDSESGGRRAALRDAAIIEQMPRCIIVDRSLAQT